MDLDIASAAVFPGQGSQKPGMGKLLADRFPEARRVFSAADQALGFAISEICFGDDPQLNLTAYTQPAILTHEIALYRCLKERFGWHADYFGGHSLGEYTALVAAGALPLDAAVQIVYRRGSLMQEAVPVGVGAMAALIAKGIDTTSVQEIAGDADFDIANVNSPNQLVISGEASQVKLACQRIKRAEKGIRAIPLNVSAPFHSRYMKGIEKDFREYLWSFEGSFDAKAAATVVSNYSGDFHEGAIEPLMEYLSHQLSSPVKWIDNMRGLLKRCQSVYEIGPSRPLRGFFKTLGVEITSLVDWQDAVRTFGE